jgi:hypothetical protein
VSCALARLVQILMEWLWNLAHRLAWLKQALEWTSRHTGVPAICVAAVAIVAVLRLAKRSARFFVEVGVVLAVLAVLTKLGVLKF